MARRNLVRTPATISTSPSPHRQQKTLQQARIRLHQERTSLARWQKRLCRAFNAVQKVQARIARLERRIAKLDENSHA